VGALVGIRNPKPAASQSTGADGPEEQHFLEKYSAMYHDRMGQLGVQMDPRRLKVDSYKHLLTELDCLDVARALVS